MAVYSFAMQYGKDTWRKIDYDKLGLTGLTNQGEYNMVWLAIRGESFRFVN